MKPLVKYKVTLESENSGRVIKTWGVYPVGQTKILDGIYDPETKELILLVDSVTEQYTPIRLMDAKNKVKIEQRKIDQYYRLRLKDDDILFFLTTYVDNNFEMVEEIINPKVNEAVPIHSEEPTESSTEK